MSEPNGLYCLKCGIPLTGKSRKFCKDSHRQAYNYAKRKERGEAKQSTDTNETINAVILFEQAKRERDLAVGEAKAVSAERDRIVRERDQALQNVSELQREIGALQAKLKILEQQKTPKTWRDRLFRR